MKPRRFFKDEHPKYPKRICHHVHEHMSARIILYPSVDGDSIILHCEDGYFLKSLANKSHGAPILAYSIDHCTAHLSARPGRVLIATGNGEPTRLQG